MKNKYDWHKGAEYYIIHHNEMADGSHANVYKCDRGHAMSCLRTSSHGWEFDGGGVVRIVTSNVPLDYEDARHLAVMHLKGKFNRWSTMDLE